MRRNALYIILSIITIISLFITAATCSFCGKQLGTASEETKVDVEETGDETGSHKETAHDTDTAQSDNEDTEKKAPTISLAISEGPIYSAADNVCWYRIKAKVTGNPTPVITWSTDYSNGSFGNAIAQVNLTRDNPSYALTANATNSEGTATDDIALSWGCDGADDTEETDEEEEPEAIEIALIADASLSGSIAKDEIIIPSICAAGDSTPNNQVKGYLSFNISELEFEINVIDAELRLDNVILDTTPVEISPFLNVKAYDYGDSLGYDDFAVGGTIIHTFDISTVIPFGDTLVINDNDALVNTLQEAIDSNRHWYQLKFGLAGTVSNDNAADIIGFEANDAKLTINYSE